MSAGDHPALQAGKLRSDWRISKQYFLAKHTDHKRTHSLRKGFLDGRGEYG